VRLSPRSHRSWRDFEQVEAEVRYFFVRGVLSDRDFPPENKDSAEKSRFLASSGRKREREKDPPAFLSQAENAFVFLLN